MRALLVATRPGLAAGESAQGASRAAALRLQLYKHVVCKLLPAAEGLSEQEVGGLVSALEAELAGVVSPVEVSEVGAAPAHGASARNGRTGEVCTPNSYL